MANVRKLPQDRKRPRRKNVYDLDSLEREGKPVEPFVATLGGEDFTFADPFEQDWQDAVAIDMNDIVGSLRFLLGDQFDAFEKHRMPMWKLRALNDAIESHYIAGLGGRGEDNASPGS